MRFHFSTNNNKSGNLGTGPAYRHDDANRASLATCVIYVIVEVLLAGGDHLPRILPESGAQLAQG